MRTTQSIQTQKGYFRSDYTMNNLDLFRRVAFNKFGDIVARLNIPLTIH